MTFEFDFTRDVEEYDKHVRISGGLGLATVPVVVKANGDYIPKMGEHNTPPDGFNDLIDIRSFLFGSVSFLTSDEDEARINIAEYAWDKWMRLTKHPKGDQLTINWEGDLNTEAEATVGRREFAEEVLERSNDFYYFIRDELMPYWEANDIGPHPAETRADLRWYRGHFAPLAIQFGRHDY